MQRTIRGKAFLMLSTFLSLIVVSAAAESYCIMRVGGKELASSDVRYSNGRVAKCHAL